MIGLLLTNNAGGISAASFASSHARRILLKPCLAAAIMGRSKQASWLRFRTSQPPKHPQRAHLQWRGECFHPCDLTSQRPSPPAVKLAIPSSSAAIPPPTPLVLISFAGKHRLPPSLPPVGGPIAHEPRLAPNQGYSTDRTPSALVYHLPPPATTLRQLDSTGAPGLSSPILTGSPFCRSLPGPFPAPGERRSPSTSAPVLPWRSKP